MSDWNPAQYAQFSDERLRPALDLLAAVGGLPKGAICDLGCGTGVMGPVFRTGEPERVLIGIDSDAKMRDQAGARGVYDRIEDARIEAWDPVETPALIYANASLNWVADHAGLLPRLVAALSPGGWLAVQMPYQHNVPSHALARAVAHQMDPEAFPTSEARPHVLRPRDYLEILAPLGAARVWRTEYFQVLAGGDSHPVRQFTQSTYLRPYLAHFAARGQEADYLAAYDAALHEAYPLEEHGRVSFPFLRLFVTLQKA